MTSKVKKASQGRTVVSISLKSLQDFDSEFRAKLDLGLAEADKNKDSSRRFIGSANRLFVFVAGFGRTTFILLSDCFFSVTVSA